MGVRLTRGVQRAAAASEEKGAHGLAARGAGRWAASWAARALGEGRRGWQAGWAGWLTRAELLARRPTSSFPFSIFHFFSIV